MNVLRSALIVANYDYLDPGLRRLRAPVHDAEALAGVLSDPKIGDFEVRTLLNEPEPVVSEAVEEFFADRRPDDLLLLHFSCHGVKDEGGELYFATSNTKLHLLGATAVAAEFVNRCMNRSRSRRVVLLLDCCYAGAFERGMLARADEGMAIDERFGGRGRAVITASSAMEYSFEGGELADTHERKTSVFTSALVEGLATGRADHDLDGYIGLDELYDYVYDKVRDATPYQTPCKWTFGVQGELYIARRSHPSPTAAPPELHQAFDHELFGVRATAGDVGLRRIAHQSVVPPPSPIALWMIGGIRLAARAGLRLIGSLRLPAAGTERALSALAVALGLASSLSAVYVGQDPPAYGDLRYSLGVTFILAGVAGAVLTLAVLPKPGAAWLGLVAAGALTLGVIEVYAFAFRTEHEVDLLRDLFTRPRWVPWQALLASVVPIGFFLAALLSLSVWLKLSVRAAEGG